MKKTTLFAISLLSFSLSFSQVLFEEDFDGSGPGLAGWTLFNLDGLTPTPELSIFSEAWIEQLELETDNMTAASNSWYQPAGTSNDWMVSPAITLTTNAILSWQEQSRDPEFPDSYEVWISTEGNNPGDFNNRVYTNAAATTGEWATRSVDLSAFIGNTIHMAWRNNSVDKFILMIDNIKVEESASFDTQVSIPDEVTYQFTQIPVGQVYHSLGSRATLENVGSNPVTNAMVTVTITDSNANTVYTATSEAYDLPLNGEQDVFFPGFVPTTADNYTVTYELTQNETDITPENNLITKNIIISETTYARDDSNVLTAFGIGAGNGGFLGQEFYIYNTQEVESISFAIGNLEGTLTGSNMKGSIWSMPNEVPGAIIAETDPVTISAEQSVIYTANMAGGAVTLTPGLYLFAIEEPSPGPNMELLVTSDVFTPGTVWIDWPSNPQESWINIELYSFEFALIIRPNFISNTLSTLETNSRLNPINLYPNPAKHNVTISNPKNTVLYKAIITDVTGRIVKRFNLQESTESSKTLDISNLSAANYFITIESQEGSVTKKLIKE
ncbi:choice-of-anchor J domain-containing protein [Bizionia sediminis]|uniref:Choice-of-anchor J domain-containing protein n=1 Tax=Bizionia sediminis TaxID=1737064 RepID=A0ABW5KUH6_9FLAO